MKTSRATSSDASKAKVQAFFVVISSLVLIGGVLDFRSF